MADNTYPNANIDPRQKGYDYILKYVKAAHNEGSAYVPFLMGSNYYAKMKEIRSYGMGNQTITKYQKINKPDQLNDTTPLNDDLTVPAIICRFREIIISRLIQREYNIQCYPVDPLAKTKEDAVFNEMKMKMIMRQEAKKAGSPLADSPFLMKQAGEPEDETELEMSREFGYKETLSNEAQMAIQLIMQQNDIFEVRKRAITDSVDFGLSAYEPYIDETGKVRFEELPADNLLLSFCEKNDFKDLVHWGVYKQVNLIDLTDYFTPEELDDIQKSVAGQWGNPAIPIPFRRSWASYKVLVLRGQFKTRNTYVYVDETDKMDNPRYGRTSYNNMQFVKDDEQLKNDEYADVETMESESEQAVQPSDKQYKQRSKEVIYKFCWVVDTDKMYKWGISENQVRTQSAWWETKLDCIAYAWNFSNMMYKGLTERMMPIADSFYLTWRKLQNLKNKLIPYLIDINMTAVENAVLGAGGKKMTKAEVMDLIFNDFLTLSRPTELQSRNPNFKTAQIQASGQLPAFQQLYQDLQFSMQMLYDLTGLNQITAGATPEARTLTSGYENANIGTDNAIYLLAVADRNLMLRLAESIFGKVQMALKLGKVEGIVTPLGSETARFISINPDLRLCDLGIFIKDAPTKEERMLLFQNMQVKDSQGLLHEYDKIKIMGMTDLQQAWKYLSTVVKKREEELRQFELEKNKQAVESQAIVIERGEAAKQQTIQMQLQADLQKINAEMQWQYIIEAMKKQSDQQEGAAQGEAKVVSAQLLAEAKIVSQHIASQGQIEASKKTAAK